jgi:hypothetical protein
MLVQTPQSYTENLEHKEWCNGVFFEQLHELWHRDIETRGQKLVCCTGSKPTIS